jgi:hypothetical protein
MMIPVSPTYSIPFSCFKRDMRKELMIDARALFERSALNIPAEKARPLWDAWARYEYMYGDLAAVTKLEARFAEVFPRGKSIFLIFNFVLIST